MSNNYNRAKVHKSLPVWGEWIEMKSCDAAGMPSMSLPVWGEWIEINSADMTTPGVASLPVWGEWIEMSCRIGKAPPTALSLPVWGEWIEIGLWCPLEKEEEVSPRVGRVD